ncbi:MAG TPA: hypothetical protein VF678_09555, partial [bacterium]
MAILSSSRRGMAFPGIAALLMVAMLALAGCGNDHPSDNGGTMKVDLRGIVSQMGGSGGGGFSEMSVGVADSPATTAVKSLIIGAVVITFTDTPLDAGTPITQDLTDKLADDVINSINYFSIVDLPTSADSVEFKVPPPGAGHWQVAAIGTRKQILTYDDLNSDDVAIYYGFTPQFFTTSGSTNPDVSITMNRACLIDTPPNGCASYDENGNAVVTDAVKVWAVYWDGNTGSNKYPVGEEESQVVGAATVQAHLNTARSGATSGTRIQVIQTHPQAADYNGAVCDSHT